jgi:uncharacterized protein (DUF302 family)
MTYYFARTLSVPFDGAMSRTMAALQAEGFGVLTEIDVKETLKKKLDVDFRRYLILGACNPAFAHEALKLEDKVGTMLLCDVIVQEIGEGQTEVPAVDPVASIPAIDNPQLTESARLVASRLQSAVESL